LSGADIPRALELWNDDIDAATIQALLEADRQAAADAMDTILGLGSGLGSIIPEVDIKTPELA
jgi:hypothetical protein